jgi:hypothetical protein
MLCRVPRSAAFYQRRLNMKNKPETLENDHNINKKISLVLRGRAAKSIGNWGRRKYLNIQIVEDTDGL